MESVLVRMETSLSNPMAIPKEKEWTSSQFQVRRLNTQYPAQKMRHLQTVGNSKLTHKLLRSVLNNQWLHFFNEKNLHFD